MESIGSKPRHYNIEQCRTVIFHVGGNDAGNGTELDSFCDEYVALLNSLAADNRRIIVSGLLPKETVDLLPKETVDLLPKETVDLEPYNEKITVLI